MSDQTLSPDVEYRDHGTILLITPISPRANAWVLENVNEIPAYMRFGANTFSADHRPGNAILDAMRGQGFTIERLA